MLKNYIKIAWRNFIRNKFYSLINILGLSIGLGCLILVMLFVTDELSYDQFHDKGDRTHFVARESQFGKNISKGLSTAFPLGRTMKETIPEVENYVTMTWPGNGAVSLDGKEYMDEQDILYSTSDFFGMFSFPLLIGNPQTVLEQKNAVVITQEMADKLFGKDEPLGQTIHLQRYDEKEFIVTGIAQNVDQNSYLEFDFVASIDDLSNVQNNRDSWGSSMYHTYVTLQKGASWSDIEPEVADLVDTHRGEDSKTVFFSIPLPQLYVSDLVSVSGFKGDMTYIYIFSAIALFILLLACINYMNLATARATQRSREVGIRKVVGAHKGQLVRQFIGEGMLTAIFAFFIGLILAEFALPFFNEFVGKELTLNLSDNIVYLLSLFGVALLVGLISGSYPAFFLSRFEPAGVLKGEARKRLSGTALRKILVVGQFAVSTLLIICTLIVFNQLRYVLDKDLGFQDEQVMYIPAHQIQDQLDTFKQTALQHSGINAATATTAVPGRYNMRIGQPFDPENPNNQLSAHFVRSDADYDDVLGLELVAGRFFDEQRPTDRDTARVINEAMLKELNWASAEEAVGRKLNDGSRIIGIVKDYHYQSLHHKIGPVLIRMKPSEPGRYSSYNMLALRFQPQQVGDVISYLQKSWDNLTPDEPMTYHFLDEKFAEQYETDQKLSHAILVFAVIAILIACMGLFGLAAFSAERRTKEIGVRKVLGASVFDIIALLSKDFLILVLVGFLIAVPVSWYAMNQWLADFAYRIEIGAGIFLLAGVGAVVIALATVSWQSVQAAVSNPVDSLRSE
ncbi:MAG: ABC transporter permease [Balneolaceae bacterium]|nr:ABC transporter permease [Balneolaceae bacterium]